VAGTAGRDPECAGSGNRTEPFNPAGFAAGQREKSTLVTGAGPIRFYSPRGAASLSRPKKTKCFRSLRAAGFKASKLRRFVIAGAGEVQRGTRVPPQAGRKAALPGAASGPPTARAGKRSATGFNRGTHPRPLVFGGKLGCGWRRPRGALGRWFRVGLLLDVPPVGSMERDLAKPLSQGSSEQAVPSFRTGGVDVHAKSERVRSPVRVFCLTQGSSIVCDGHRCVRPPARPPRRPVEPLHGRGVRRSGGQIQVDDVCSGGS